MDSEWLLFEKGCFLPSWAEDVKQEEVPVLNAYQNRNKSLETLLSELAQIKNHLEDVRERQWQLAKLIDYHNHNFA